MENIAKFLDGAKVHYRCYSRLSRNLEYPHSSYSRQWTYTKRKTHVTPTLNSDLTALAQVVLGIPSHLC